MASPKSNNERNTSSQKPLEFTGIHARIPLSIQKHLEIMSMRKGRGAWERETNRVLRRSCQQDFTAVIFFCLSAGAARNQINWILSTIASFHRLHLEGAEFDFASCAVTARFADFQGFVRCTPRVSFAGQKGYGNKGTRLSSDPILST